MKPRIVLTGLVWAAIGCSQSVVTLCPLDTQAGAGVNFAAAMSKGGNITFSPACTTIHITRTYAVSTRTAIAGGNRITLDTTVPLGTNGMFSITGTAELILQQITLKPTTAFAVVTGQTASLSRVTLYQTHVVGPAMSAVSAVGTTSSVGGTFVNITGVALNADNVDFENSECDNCGVAIESSGSATISASTFSGGSSGVVCQKGSLNITGSHFLNFKNGAVKTWCATVIGNSDFQNNKSDAGGAISVNALPPGVNAATPGPQSSSISISGSTFTGNSATGAGGAVSVLVSATAAPQVVLRHVVFDSNTADHGGALDLSGFVLRGAGLDAAAVVFSKNTAVHDGGGLHGTNVSGRISRGIFVNNKAGGAGGGAGMVSLTPQQLTVANSLFAGNSAASGSAFSGALARFVNATVAGNNGTAISVLRAPLPRNIILVPGGQGSVSSQVSMVNSLLSGNQTNCAGFAGMTGPVIVDGGHNSQFPGNACNASIPSIDPQLDSMLVPAPGNAVLVGGDNTVCAGPDIGNIDVWAQFRPRGRNCSMGAIEGGMETLVLQQNPGTVLPVRQGDFSLTADPMSQKISGSTATVQYKISVNPLNGFSGEVSYGVSNLPSGMTASFSPASGMASVLTIANGPLVTPGPYALAVSGTSGAVTHSISVTLAVEQSAK